MILVADSSRYSNFLEEKYKKKSTYIAYGAHPFTSPDESIILDYVLKYII
jgi:hypothetical protein